MKTSIIRKQINKTIEKDQASSQFYGQVESFLTQIRQDNSPEAVNGIVVFVYDYLRRVPELMTVLFNESIKAGIQTYIQPILNIIENYFEEKNDLIPDESGIIGTLDDAYFAMFFIQSINNSYMQQTGKALISLDYTSSNHVIRVLLGEPVASQLELLAMNSLIQYQIIPLVDNYRAPMTFNDPIWGDLSIEKRVNIQLGALGIF